MGLIMIFMIGFGGYFLFRYGRKFIGMFQGFNEFRRNKNALALPSDVEDSSFDFRTVWTDEKKAS